jgi:hypothetical protein
MTTFEDFPPIFNKTVWGFGWYNKRKKRKFNPKHFIVHMAVPLFCELPPKISWVLVKEGIIKRCLLVEYFCSN